MSEFIILGDDDDTLFRSTFHNGSGISSYNGGGGYDTLDFSSATDGFIWFEFPYNWVQDPNYPAGFVEEIGREVFLFAYIVNFEHIIAGSGQDIIYIADSQMTLDGGLGNDIFLFSDVNAFDDGDHYIGNEGDDILDFSGQTSPDRVFVFNHLLGEITYDNKTAQFDGFENVYGTAGNDTFIPALGTFVYNGNGGNDVFDLDAGTFSSGATYLGSDGVDTIKYTESTDGLTVDMSSGGMSFDGTFGRIFAFIGDFEIVLAGSGDDTLIGMAGRQRLEGGDGDDQIEGLGGNDLLLGQEGNDTVLGGNGRDTISGGSGDDELRGGRGNDDIRGGEGSDFLEGGRGNDVMQGGSEADTFSFRNGHGRDRIEDFDIAEGDVIDLSAINRFRDFDDVLNRASNTSDGVEIATNRGGSILLVGLSESDLEADAFLF